VNYAVGGFSSAVISVSVFITRFSWYPRSFVVVVVSDVWCNFAFRSASPAVQVVVVSDVWCNFAFRSAVRVIFVSHDFCDFACCAVHCVISCKNNIFQSLDST